MFKNIQKCSKVYRKVQKYRKMTSLIKQIYISQVYQLYVLHYDLSESVVS